MTSDLQNFTGNIGFNAQHSPMGAFASFTCGNFGTRGGLGTQIGKPAGHDLYIGVKEGTRFESAPIKCLPFFYSTAGGGAGAADFLVEQAAGPSEQNIAPNVVAIDKRKLNRQYGWATDCWLAENFTFTIYTPFGEIPDPARADPLLMKNAIRPAVVAELAIDNTNGTATLTGVFAMNFNEPGWLPIESAGTLRRGFSLRNQMGVLGEIVSENNPSPADDATDNDIAPSLFCRWSPDQGLAQPIPHLLGSCPGLCFEVPPGERRVLRVAMGWYLESIVTTGLEGRYLYTGYFSSLAEVLSDALEKGDPAPVCDRLDRQLNLSGLSDAQQFQIAHATRSYYGSTQLLDIGGKPFWIVNEGEYCMMNTLDLSVDQMFWELDQNPWVVRNLLDHFVSHYSYVDALKNGPGRTIAGGLSFTHDMGAHNNFSPRGQSSYELPELDAVCFSYMTAEQLANWILVAVTYVTATGDVKWARQNGHVFLACLDSLRNRAGESGIPEFDSTRCGDSGAEITTYDSLDHSLAQTRNSLYMGAKFWASFRGLANVFGRLGGTAWLDARGKALVLAERAAETVCRQANPDGVIPAVFEPNNSGYHSRILPAAEGLLYPYMWGENVSVEAPALFEALQRHVLALLRDEERRNLFADGGIKLSSTSNNSWMSKIALFQHVARVVLHVDDDPKIAELFQKADAAHVLWQTEGSAYWACSDQFVNGVARGSRYYPRIITAALWMSTEGGEANDTSRPSVTQADARWDSRVDE